MHNLLNFRLQLSSNPDTMLPILNLAMTKTFNNKNSSKITEIQCQASSKRQTYQNMVNQVEVDEIMLIKTKLKCVVCRCKSNAPRSLIL